MWLHRKTRASEEKRKEAQIFIQEAGEVGLDEDFIRAQWRAQVREQTRPDPSAYSSLVSGE